MLVSSAEVATPASFAELDHRARRARGERSMSFRNAPEPNFTSSTSAPVPSAIFLVMIDDAISGIASTVPVMSRSA